MRGWVVVVALLGVPNGAFGSPAEADIGFSVAYDQPAGCPSRIEFEQAIVSRAPEARPVEREAATLRFEVELIADSPGTHAVLVTTLPDGTRSRRDVTAESCSEAISALAVIAALAVSGYRDSNALTSGSPKSSGEPNTLAAEPADEARNATKQRGSESRRTARRTDESVTRTPTMRTRASRTTPLRPGAFANVTWESAVAPSAPFGASAGVELAWAPSDAWWPNLRAGVLATLVGSVTQEEGNATFRLTAARVGFCPVGWGGTSAPAVRACVELDAGTFDASGSGSNVQNERDRAMPWLAAGLSGRGEWPLASWISVEASAGLRALARHDVFVFAPETLVYDVPWLSGGLGLGVVGRLP